MEQAQMVAGSVAGVIFASGSLNMLVKAWRTKDLHSYSLGQIVLYNIGNLLYWLYVTGLPFGPIWLMHTFYTITMLLMLTWYMLYVRPPVTSQQMIRRLKGIASWVHTSSPDNGVSAIQVNTNANPSASDIA